MMIFISLGFAALFASIETVSHRLSIKQHRLGIFKQEISLILYVCAMMIVLSLLAAMWWQKTAWNSIYWVILNLLFVVTVYGNLMLKSVGSFIIIQGTGAVIFWSTGMLTPILFIVYMFAGGIIFTERLYGQFFDEHPFLYFLPPAIIGIGAWFTLYMVAPMVNVGLLIHILNYLIGCVVLFLYNHFLRTDQQVLAKLTQEIQYDGLTGARNWQMFSDDLDREYAKVSRGQSLALIVFDIDHFKNINDTYGHLAGNQVLMSATSVVNATLNSVDRRDCLYRTGGEEFAIVLSNCSVETAKYTARLCQTAIRKLLVRDTGHQITITASFGVTGGQHSDRNATNMFRRADKNLYNSKGNGRDQITIDGMTSM